jgi:hypothetical protein
MALNKQVTTKYNVIAEYHKITEINISWHFKTCSVVLSSYKDKQSRDINAVFLDNSYFDFNDTAFDFDVEANLTEQLYNKIKQESKFIDATDN